MEFDRTRLQPEEACYPHGRQTRKGTAIFPDGKVRRVHAGIPDTFFSIPAHARIAGRRVAGYLTVDDVPKADGTPAPELRFHPYAPKPAGAAR